MQDLKALQPWRYADRPSISHGCLSWADAVCDARMFMHSDHPITQDGSTPMDAQSSSDYLLSVGSAGYATC